MSLFDKLTGEAKQLADEAKHLVEERGGTDALKADAAELKNIVTGEGSLTTKAQEAVQALKDPGAPGDPAKPAEAAPARPAPQQ